MNQVVLVGRLTRDPELKYIPGTGTAVASFTIAVDRNYINKEGKRDTDFIPIEVIGKSAEYCANYITKGKLVALEGNIRVDNYQTQSGEKRTFTKVSTKSVQSLESKSKSSNSYKESVQDETIGLDPQGFEIIDDDELPF
ncbi:TPA: single-stranded DNA-binding protein [Clostridioides difficile]|uniref:single-stranded DNA-binding protein n=1 Tax=Clostridioides TaxID=1870884 RepID=UPI00093FAD75|nr:single-stranded DNA-binding protein [Clostridioides difficile]MCC0633848.1 single-stranded DNA-binding protein [Clostridioides sp. ZZV15-6388]MCC0660384.1 single-stranded DNA-binding protein [Clostridioides sp. ZZV14-6154]MCC0719067.1 single-stranded DNA-binding protein [Clostridioides sp. ZZV14-6105]MCC0720814.1 single-stranded DNA-binding protein [Clostridioides sp. ZZV14-6104]MCC0725250.1 single-stranded DNA-binding protein [Clostridioides sp. ZZV14-6045]MCC0741377.1 single-stranded DNA